MLVPSCSTAQCLISDRKLGLGRMVAHAAAGSGDGSLNKAMDKCLEEMKKALHCSTADAEREKHSMLNLLDHCIRNTGLLERATSFKFSVLV